MLPQNKENKTLQFSISKPNLTPSELEKQKYPNNLRGNTLNIWHYTNQMLN